MKRLLAILLPSSARSGVPAAARQAVNVKSLDMGKNVQVWYVEDHTLPMIAMTAALPAGSAYDPKDKAGTCSVHGRSAERRCRQSQIAGITRPRSATKPFG